MKGSIQRDDITIIMYMHLNEFEIIWNTNDRIKRRNRQFHIIEDW